MTTVSQIHVFQSANHLTKIFSILLKINEGYSKYDAVNTGELADMYFHLFFQLSIKGMNDVGFSLWKAGTSIDRIRTIDFMNVVEEFFSEKKRRYI